MQRARTNGALIITGFGWPGMSTPVHNTATYLLEQGWEVTIASIGPNLSRFPFSREIATKANIRSFSSPGRNIRARLAIAKELLMLGSKSSLVFLYDHQALLYAALAMIFGKSNSSIYYSLEFYEPTTRSQKILKKCERFLSRRCVGVITQHATRAGFLRNDGIGRRIWIVPNSPRGEYIGKVKQHKNQVEIRPCNLQLLCVGTLHETTCVEDLLNWFLRYSGRWSLKLHGWFASQKVQDLANQVKLAKKHQLHLSTQFVDAKQKWAIYQESDVVFVGFSAATANLSLAAGSAGKLYDALRCGKPIVAMSNIGMRDIIESCNVGIVIDSMDEMESALWRIEGQYDRFSANCESAHRQFSHDRHLTAVMAEVNQLSRESALLCGRDAIKT